MEPPADNIEIPPVEQRVDEVKESIAAINEIENHLDQIRKDGNTVTPVLIADQKSSTKGKKVDELKAHILELEAGLELPHKGISSMKKKDLEKYLGELCDIAIKKDSFVSDKKPLGDRVELPDAQPTISQQLKEDIKQQIRQNQAEAIHGSTQANALFHFNLIAMFLLERTTEQFEDQLHGSITGATRELREDYAKPDSPLRDLYMEIYAKYGKTIEPYMDPITRLTVYNLSIVQRSIKRKIEKKKDEQ